MKKHFHLLAITLFIVNSGVMAQVGVGTTTPDNSAALEVLSTTKGFLPPRLTSSQMDAISSPAEGLMVYCSDCSPKGIYYFNGDYFLNSTSGLINGFDADLHVVSPTGKVWLSKNLGATQIATVSADTDSYGTLYQWGRNTDGHEITTSSITAGPVDVGTEGSNYITTTGKDWLNTSDDTRWNGMTKGTEDPCPSGFRIPTEAEFTAELALFSSANAAGAFASTLKLPVGGQRKNGDGTLASQNSQGFYWTSSVNGTSGVYLTFSSGSAIIGTTASRANGFSVRCIKE